MEAGNILSADVLDIIFDARNKDYGAYDLRKNYQRRLFKAVAVTVMLALCICVTYVLLGSMKKEDPKSLLGPVVNLTAVEPPEKKDEVKPPPPPPPPPPVQQVKMIDFVTPVIAADVPESEMPEQSEADDAKIGTANIDGKADDGTQEAPVEAARAVVDEPKDPDADKEKIFTAVEIESGFPGGIAAWVRFLSKNAQYTEQLVDEGVEGTVMVLFIVDTEGNVSEVSALSGPDELRKIAVAAIKKSGKWEPAIQNGRKVKSYKRQPITFKLPAE